MAGHAERMMALFGGFEGAHGTHGRPDVVPGAAKATIRSTARTVREPITIATWESHLRGERPLGVIPIRSDGTCTWGSIDYDVYDADLSQVVARVQEQRLPLVPSRSKSGGLHLWLFLSEAVPAALVISVLTEMAAGIGMAGSEIFPKQTRLMTDRGDVGTWIVVPYFGQTYDGLIKIQAGLTADGDDLSVDQFLELAEARTMTASDLEALARTPRRRPTNGHTEPRGDGAWFSDGPPCLQNLTDLGFPEGTRNRSLFMIGVYARKRDPSGWRDFIREANDRLMRPPLSLDEVTAIIKSVAKRDYHYTCRAEPMASFCNSALCRTRQHGVGDEGHVPRITGLSVLDIDPPTWFLDVDGERVVMTTRELTTYTEFNRAVSDQIHRHYHVMKQADWSVVIGAAMEERIVVAAPPDVGISRQFRELLHEFLTDTVLGARPEDVLTHRPWFDEENNRYCFRLKDLQRYCKTQKFEIDRAWMSRQLDAMGGGSVLVPVKGHDTPMRWLPKEWSRS